MSAPKRILVIDTGTAPLIEGSTEVRSGWFGGPGTFEVPADLDLIVYFDTAPASMATSLHLLEGEAIRQRVTSGAVFLAFLQQAEQYRLSNLLGIQVVLQNVTQLDGLAANIVPAPGPFFGLFSQYSNTITRNILIGVDGGEPLATHRQNGQPIAQLVRLGAGIAVLLPMMGPIQEVARRAAELALSLVERPVEQWINSPAYWMPTLESLHAEEEALRAEYEGRLSQVRERIDRQYSTDQAEVNKLLTATGDELVVVVARALTELGISVVNADEETRPEGREEDLWLNATAISNPAADVTHLCEVKGHRKQTASDDDYGALEKYLRRRSSEWKRTDLRGLLIVNQQAGRPVDERLPAFSAKQIADAEADPIGIGLLASAELFQLLRRFRSKQVTPDEARRLVLDSKGKVAL